MFANTSGVETLAAELRLLDATVFVSHSSFSRDDRWQAERAFSETRDCVIVSTSTLELGTDEMDLLQSLALVSLVRDG